MAKKAKWSAYDEADKYTSELMKEWCMEQENAEIDADMRGPQ